MSRSIVIRDRETGDISAFLGRAMKSGFLGFSITVVVHRSSSMT